MIVSKLRKPFILMFGNLYVIFYLKWMKFFFFMKTFIVQPNIRGKAFESYWKKVGENMCFNRLLETENANEVH